MEQRDPLIVERGRYWTTVEVRNDCVVVRPRRRFISAGIGVTFFLFFAYVTADGIDFRYPLGVAFSLLFVSVFCWIVVLIVRNALRTPRELHILSLPIDLPHADAIWDQDIEQLICRENTGRGEDSPRLGQLHVRLRGADQSVMIYQRYWMSRRKVVEMARFLAARWKVPLEDRITKDVAGSALEQ